MVWPRKSHICPKDWPQEEFLPSSTGSQGNRLALLSPFPRDTLQVLWLFKHPPAPCVMVAITLNQMKTFLILFKCATAIRRNTERGVPGSWPRGTYSMFQFTAGCERMPCHFSNFVSASRHDPVEANWSSAACKFHLQYVSSGMQSMND